MNPLTFSPILNEGSLVLGVEFSALMLLEASESPLLGVGEGSRFGTPVSDFLEARGLEEVLCDVGAVAGGLILTAPASSPSDFRLLALETEISVESSLLVLLGLDLELGVWRERKSNILHNHTVQ